MSVGRALARAPLWLRLIVVAILLLVIAGQVAAWVIPYDQQYLDIVEQAKRTVIENTAAKIKSKHVDDNALMAVPLAEASSYMEKIKNKYLYGFSEEEGIVGMKSLRDETQRGVDNNPKYAVRFSHEKRALRKWGWASLLILGLGIVGMTLNWYYLGKGESYAHLGCMSIIALIVGAVGALVLFYKGGRILFFYVASKFI